MRSDLALARTAGLIGRWFGGRCLGCLWPARALWRRLRLVPWHGPGGNELRGVEQHLADNRVRQEDGRPERCQIEIDRRSVRSRFVTRRRLGARRAASEEGQASEGAGHVARLRPGRPDVCGDSAGFRWYVRPRGTTRTRRSPLPPAPRSGSRGTRCRGPTRASGPRGGRASRRRRSCATAPG